MREGSLEAPTRHIIDWQNPDYFDADKLEAEMRRLDPTAYAGERGASAEVAVNGVFDITKEAPLVIAVGARVFWDNTNKRVTTTATGNVAIGHAVVAAASADTTARVRLSGSTAAGT